MKKIICLFMIITFIAIVPMEVFATDEVMYNLIVSTVDDVSDIGKCVFLNTKDKNEVRTVNSFAMQKINDIDAAEETIVETLFDNIGISFFEESAMQKYLIENIKDIKNISTNTCYTMVDKNGEVTYMDKEDCLSELSELKDNTLSVTSTSEIIGDNNEKTSENGYMKSTIAYFYNGNGYYILAGEWEWLKQPAITRKDAFSLFSTEMVWGNLGEKNYEKVTSYHSYITQNDQVVQNKTITNTSQADPVIDTDGVFYTWNLPTSTSSSTSSNVYTNYMCQLWANARVQDYDDYTQELYVYSRYVHKKVSLSTTYAISIAKRGVAINASGTTSTAAAKAYPHYFKWDYKEDAIANGEY